MEQETREQDSQDPEVLFSGDSSSRAIAPAQCLSLRTLSLHQAPLSCCHSQRPSSFLTTVSSPAHSAVNSKACEWTVDLMAATHHSSTEASQMSPSPWELWF